jgi:hypothetical protein
MGFICVRFRDILGLGQSQSNFVNLRSKNRNFQFSEVITFLEMQYRVQCGGEIWWQSESEDFWSIFISEISWDLTLFLEI